MEEYSPPFNLCERTFRFALLIVKYCQTLDQHSSVARTLAKQLLRSGTSIGANIEEAQAGQSRADFVSKYSIARKEARETRYWLKLLTASNISSNEEVDSLLTEINELISILTTIIKKTEKKTTKQV